MHIIRLIFNVTMMMLFFSMPAYAHKVSVFAWVEGDTIHTQSKFSGGKKVKGGKIEVFNHLNQTVLDGITDDRGYFAFPVNKAAKTLKVVLTAGMGHSNHWLVTAQELGHENKEKPVQASPPSSPPDKKYFPDYKTIEQIVERAVEKKLAPLKSRLAEQAWGLRDIVAGIGYIIGLMGLASYIHYRKRSKQ